MTNSYETCPAELPNWCAQRHWGIFWILIIASVVVVAARVLSLGDPQSDGMSQGRLPFFSANDRSRWVTVRALVDHGTFEIDRVIFAPDGKKWDTIDKVRHVGRDGRFHYFSSKPPLLSVIVAGGYWCLKTLLGWEIARDTTSVVRVLLMLINVPLWAVYLWFVSRMINSVPVRDWTRYFVLGCAGFATFLSTFAISLNNHLPAAVAIMIALYLVSEICRKTCDHWLRFAAAGFFAAGAVALELPALIFLVMASLLVAGVSLRKTITAFVPGASLVLAVSLLCNWWAWGEWRPAYSHRHDGPVRHVVSGDFDEQLNRGQLPSEISAQIANSMVDPYVEQGRWPDTPIQTVRWVIRDLDPNSVAQYALVSERKPLKTVGGETSVATNEVGKSFKYELLDWGNWYDYPGSYWLSDNQNKSEIDRGQLSVSLYAFHLLFGHHGICSLSPLWLLSFAGMLALVAGVRISGRYGMRWLGVLALTATVVVVAFYLSRPVTERNYGGVCCTARWLLWLVPIWLMTMLPVVDWLGGSRWGRAFCFGLMAVSAISALVHADNPWTTPWLYDLWSKTAWPR